MSYSGANLRESHGYWSTAHVGFTEYSKFLRENFDPRYTQFIVSSISNTLELSGSDSEVEFIEAIGMYGG